MQRFVVLGLAIGLLAACDAPTTPQSATTADTPASPDTPQSVKQATTGAAATDEATKDQAASARATASPVEIQLEPATYEQLLERIEQQAGRVVVVDVWSTSCVPCMKEFPHLVELARRWPEEIVCMSMNVDYIGLPKEPVEKVSPKVVEFLKSQKADPPNLINLIGSEPDTDMLAKLEVESMPAILVFDRAGQLVSKLTLDNAGEDGLTYPGDVLPLVESLAKPK